VLTPERKREIVAEITEAILTMERENKGESAWVIFQEARSRDRRNRLRVTLSVTELQASN